MDFVFAPQNAIFSVALAVMLGIALLEGVMTLLGIGFSGALDALLPDIDFDSPTIDAGDGIAASEIGSSALSRFLGWLMVGKVPALVLLVALLTGFGLIGLLLQGMVQSVTGMLLPGWIAAVPAIAVAMPLTRWIGRGIVRIIPADETSAVSRREFIGLVATVTLGTGRPGRPVQARLRDRHGQSHYVMVEPDRGAPDLAQGTEVLLVSRVGSRFRAIPNPNTALAG